MAAGLVCKGFSSYENSKRARGGERREKEMPSTRTAFGNVGPGKVPRAQRGWVMQERIFEPLAPEQGCTTAKPDSFPFPLQVQELEL